MTDLLTFASPGRPIVVRGAAALLPQLALHLKGWPTSPGSGTADIEVARKGSSYEITSPALQAPSSYNDRQGAALGLASTLIASYAQQDKRKILAHAASVECRAGLLLLLGDSGAGKSTLALQMLALGHRLFGDDRLTLDLTTPPLGIAPGLQPKARLPLPPGAALARLVAERQSFRLSQTAYLALDDDALALAGEAQPVAALIALKRGTSPEPRLDRASGGAALAHFMTCCFAPHLQTAELLSAVDSALKGLPLFTLAYPESLEAASLLSSHFGFPL